MSFTCVSVFVLENHDDSTGFRECGLGLGFRGTAVTPAVF